MLIRKLMAVLLSSTALINSAMPNSSENHLDFFNMLYESAKMVMPLKGRQLFPIAATVAKNNDPDGKRRIKVLDPTKGAKVESDWIKPLRVMPQSDPPLPRVNDTVILFFLNGDPDDALYLPLINDVNSPLSKSDAANDHAEVIPGNRYKQVKGNEETTIEGFFSRTIKGELSELIEDNFNINSLKQIALEAIADFTAKGLTATISATGASITLAGGVITWKWAGGGTERTMTMGSTGAVTWAMGGSNMTFDMGGGALNITNASGFTINGVSVASIGAKDSRLDTLTTQGWTPATAAP